VRLSVEVEEPDFFAFLSARLSVRPPAPS
jgi:hypothetical protein